MAIASVAALSVGTMIEKGIYELFANTKMGKPTTKDQLLCSPSMKCPLNQCEKYPATPTVKRLTYRSLTRIESLFSFVSRKSSMLQNKPQTLQAPVVLMGMHSCQCAMSSWYSSSLVIKGMQVQQPTQAVQQYFELNLLPDNWLKITV